MLDLISHSGAEQCVSRSWARTAMAALRGTTNFRLSDGCGGRTITTAAQFEYDITMDLKAVWEMSVHKC